MIFRATLYSIAAYIVSSFVFWLFPNLMQGAWGTLNSFLIAPFLAGFVIHAKDGLEFPKSERWSYALVFSSVQIISVCAFVGYYLGTPEGTAIMVQNNVELGMVTYLVFGLCAALMFLIYLFANRIGFGLGIRYGKFVDNTRNRAMQKQGLNSSLRR
ncbi:MAG: hypothetical protein AAGA53_11835 [Pseudomonadota bacterium]